MWSPTGMAAITSVNAGDGLISFEKAMYIISDMDRYSMSTNAAALHNKERKQIRKARGEIEVAETKYSANQSCPKNHIRSY